MFDRNCTRCGTPTIGELCPDCREVSLREQLAAAQERAERAEAACEELRRALEAVAAAPVFPAPSPERDYCTAQEIAQEALAAARACGWLEEPRESEVSDA